MTIARVAIIGLGLLGGSIGLAVKTRRPGIVTTGWDRDPGWLRHFGRVVHFHFK